MHAHVRVCVKWGQVEARVAGSGAQQRRVHRRQRWCGGSVVTAGSGAQQRMVHRWQRWCGGSVVTAECPQGKLRLVLLTAASLLRRALDHLNDTDILMPFEVTEFLESFTRVDV